MDRNQDSGNGQNIKCRVALRKESVDRNLNTMQVIVIVMVALRKESVDRNTIPENPMISIDKSLSARRAWIEMYELASHSRR